MPKKISRRARLKAGVRAVLPRLEESAVIASQIGLTQGVVSALSAVSDGFRNTRIVEKIRCTIKRRPPTPSS